MSYPDESPRRRFERASHRAEDWEVEPRVEPRRYESNQLYGAGRAPIPEVDPRARRLPLPPIEDTDPRVAFRQDTDHGQSRREIVVRRESPRVMPPLPVEDPLADSRRNVYFAVQWLIWLGVVLVLVTIFILGSFIFHHVR